MIICKNCGVELEPCMQYCPLCELRVEGDLPATASSDNKNNVSNGRNMTQPQRKATWEIVSIIILLVIMATSLLNFILNKKISWAEYPMASCLVIFSYVSVFAFLHKKREVQIFYVFIMAAVLIFLLDLFTNGIGWSVYLGIPILLFLNVILAGTIFLFRKLKHKGINLLAYSFFAAALLCIGTEAVIDNYVDGAVHLVWSLIVAGSVLPVITVLLFIHVRLKKGNDLIRIFHI
jgi:hypothetical protein